MATQKQMIPLSYDPAPLTNKQKHAALLLAEGGSGVEVAKASKVTPQTIIQWKKNHKFISLTNHYRHEMANSSFDRFRYGLKLASDTLIELLSDKDSKIRLAAASAIMDRMADRTQIFSGCGCMTVQSLLVNEVEYAQRRRLPGDNSDKINKLVKDYITESDALYAEQNPVAESSD